MIELCRRGHVRDGGRCEPCLRIARAAWKARNPESRREHVRQAYSMRQSAIATLKLAAGCADCGYAEHPEALDFDHVGPKVRGIGAMATRASIEAILDEIEKCEVVCANCHRVRTASRKRVARAASA